MAGRELMGGWWGRGVQATERYSRRWPGRTDGRKRPRGGRVPTRRPAGAGGSQVHAALATGLGACGAVPCRPRQCVTGMREGTAARRAQRRGASCVRGAGAGAGAGPNSMLRPEAGWLGFLCPPVARHGHEPSSD